MRTKNNLAWSAFLAGALILAATAAIARAEHTRRWKQSTYEEFLKGTTHGVAVRSDGRLELAPKFTQLADADASYLWGLKLDAKGTLYAAGGSPAKVFRLDASGKTSTVFDSNELNAQAIAFDPKGTLYVATSPDGKVYRVSASGEKSVFFEPKSKYIWDMEFSADGTLYVATGDKGQIYTVTPDGKSELFYSSDETHIKVLAFDAKANVIAGTEPSGRVLRLTRNAAKKNPATDGVADGFVLYETPKREVTSLVVGADGSIYAAAIGDRPHNAAQSGTSAAAAQAVTTITSSGNVTVINPGQAVGQPIGTPFVAFPPLISSGIYKISAEGAPEELWSSREDVVYSLGFGPDGRLLAGTGNNGAILTVDGHGVFAQLAKAGSAQVTGITRNAAGRVFLCTANPGKLVALGPEYEPEGTYESRSFDAQLFSQWGRIDWWTPPAANSAAVKSSEPRLEFYVRTGNTEDPGKEWSRWYGPYSKPGSDIEAPSARLIQWKAVIHDGRPGDGIDWVSVAYQPRNVAPVIDGIALQDPNVRAQGIQMAAPGQAQQITLKQPPTPASSGIIFSSAVSSSTKQEFPPQGFAQKGYFSVLWSAHDDNDDDLRYSVLYRAEGDHDWKILKDRVDQKYFSFDSTSLPDGAYYLKIVASDLPSNPPATALKSERESERFEIDNTPPIVEQLEAVRDASGNQLRVKFVAKDSSSSVERAEYSLDGGDWILVAPKSGISDSPLENYEFAISNLAPGEHTISVRAFDRFDNVGAAKITTTLPVK